MESMTSPTKRHRPPLLGYSDFLLPLVYAAFFEEVLRRLSHSWYSVERTLLARRRNAPPLHGEVSPSLRFHFRLLETPVNDDRLRDVPVI